MSDRDTLADLLKAKADRDSSFQFRIEHYQGLADRALAAGWRPPAREITTPAELDALQPAQELVDSHQSGRVGLAAVIRDAHGNVFTRDMDNLDDEIHDGRHAGWWESGTGRDDHDSSTMAYPVTVLLNPTEEA